MRQENIYKFEELSEDAKNHAIETWRDNNHEIFWQDEIFQSLEKLFKVAGIKLRDYSLDLWGYSYLKIDIDDQIADLSGVRALTWLENNLFYKLRITRKEYLENRKDYFRYGLSYRIGAIKPCPLTGCYADEDYIEALINNIKNGSTLKGSFERLAKTYVKLLQVEYDSQREDNYISEHLIANEYEFLEDGTKF